MIPYTTCQKCKEVLDAANVDAYGNKHPSDESCTFWERLEEWENQRSLRCLQKKLATFDIGESGA